MKSIGIVRGVDDLGRVVIPKEIRRTFGIKEGESVEFYTDSEGIFMKKYMPGCIFCGNMEKITEFKGKTVCKECVRAFSGRN